MKFTLESVIVCSVEQVTGKPAHPFLKRHIFFAHRELKEILDCYEKKTPFYLYTGRVGHVPVQNRHVFQRIEYLSK